MGTEIAPSKCKLKPNLKSLELKTASAAGNQLRDYLIAAYPVARYGLLHVQTFEFP